MSSPLKNCFAFFVFFVTVASCVGDEPHVLTFVLQPGNPHHAIDELPENSLESGQDRNAALAYLRAVNEQVSHSIVSNLGDNMDTPNPDRDYLCSYWLDLPLDELPQDKVKQFTDLFEAPIEAALNLDFDTKCDWQLNVTPRDLFIGYSEETSQLRLLNEILNVKARYHILRGEIPQAIRHINASLVLAKNLVNGPHESYVLAGCNSAHQAMDSIELLILLPNCPNLKNMLHRFSQLNFDIHKSLQYKRDLYKKALPGLKKLTKEKWDITGLTDVQLEIVRWESLLDDLKGWKYFRGIAVIGQVEKARQTLKNDGSPAERYQDLSDLEAVLVVCYRDYLAAQQKYYAAFGDSYTQSYPEIKKYEEQYMESYVRLDSVLTGTFLFKGDILWDHTMHWERMTLLNDRIEKLKLINLIRSLSKIDESGSIVEPSLDHPQVTEFRTLFDTRRQDNATTISTAPDAKFAHKPIGRKYRLSFKKAD